MHWLMLIAESLKAMTNEIFYCFNNVSISRKLFLLYTYFSYTNGKFYILIYKVATFLEHLLQGLDNICRYGLY